MHDLLLLQFRSRHGRVGWQIRTTVFAISVSPRSTGPVPACASAMGNHTLSVWLHAQVPETKKRSTGRSIDRSNRLLAAQATWITIPPHRYPDSRLRDVDFCQIHVQPIAQTSEPPRLRGDRLICALLRTRMSMKGISGRSHYLLLFLEQFYEEKRALVGRARTMARTRWRSFSSSRQSSVMCQEGKPVARCSRYVASAGCSRAGRREPPIYTKVRAEVASAAG